LQRYRQDIITLTATGLEPTIAVNTIASAYIIT